MSKLGLKRLDTYFQYAIIRMRPDGDPYIESDGDFLLLHRTTEEARTALRRCREGQTQDERRKYGGFRVAKMMVREVTR